MLEIIVKIALFAIMAVSVITLGYECYNALKKEPKEWLKVPLFLFAAVLIVYFYSLLLGFMI